MGSKITVLLVASLLVSGCSHYYYVANVQNVPLLAEKNESKLSGAFAFGDESNSIEFQGSYAVTGKIGLMADLMTAWGGDYSDRDSGKGTYLDGAVGYYKPFGGSWIFDLYGGLGGGSQRHEYSGYHYDPSSGAISRVYNGNSHLVLMKQFLQPSLGLKKSFFEIAISTRLSRISYITVDNNITPGMDDYEELNSISHNAHFFLEPAGTLRVGWGNFKIQLQGLYNLYLKEHIPGLQEEFHLSIGAVLNFPGKTNLQ